MNANNPLQFFDMEEVQKLLEAHFKLTGIISKILDPEGKVIAAVGWQDICTRFHPTTPVSCAHCKESDPYTPSRLADIKVDFLEYKCKNGLWDVALPIYFDGELVATYITGQFFYEDDMPDRERFRTQAAEFGFNEAEYLDALDRVPVFSRSQIKTAVDYYRSLLTLMADAGQKKLSLFLDRQEHSTVKGSLEESEATLRTITDAARDAIIVIDNDGKITFWNPAAESILGWLESEALGQDLHQLITPECYYPAANKSICSVQKHRPRGCNSKKHRSTRTTKRWFRDSDRTVPVRHEAKKPVACSRHHPRQQQAQCLRTETETDEFRV